MDNLQKLKKYLRHGQVYRREDLALWSNAVDRHLQQLLEEGTLTKVAAGMYYCPKKTTFGAAPAEENKLVEAFLKDRHFLLTSYNAYNSLGLGTTQLYNQTIVYNHKRHGHFELDGRMFEFRMKPRFPSKLSKEFLLVDMLNNMKELAEDEEKLMQSVKSKLSSFDKKTLLKLAKDFGTVRTRKFFTRFL
jgi:hypothetical protein